MPKRKRAAAIITSGQKILLMKRHKNDLDYYALPGGTIEDGETPQETIVREIKEETTLDIELGEILFELDTERDYGYYFAVKNMAGNPTLSGPELEKNSMDNHYELVWLDIAELKNINLFPEELKTKLLEIFPN